jgi:hypothetical protein
LHTIQENNNTNGNEKKTEKMETSFPTGKNYHRNQREIKK